MRTILHCGLSVFTRAVKAMIEYRLPLVKSSMVLIWLGGVSVFSQTSTVNYIRTTSYPNGLENTAISGLSAGEMPNNTSLQSIGYFNGWAQSIQSRTLSDQTGFSIVTRQYYDIRGRLLVGAKPAHLSGNLDYQSLDQQGYLNSFSGGADSTFERMVYDRDVEGCLRQSMPFGSVYHNAARTLKYDYVFDSSWQAIRLRTTDEDGQISESYSDRLGRMIRKVTKMNMASEDLVTLFSYDGVGNLLETICPNGIGATTAVPFLVDSVIPFGTYGGGGDCDYLSYSDSAGGRLLGLEADNPNNPVIRYYRPARSLSATVTISHYVSNPGCAYTINLQYRTNKTGCWKSIGAGASIPLSPVETLVEVQRQDLRVTGTGCTQPTIHLKVEATAQVIDAKYATTYKYDSGKRLIEKNSVDEGKTQYVYDDSGRLRLVQDQNRRNKMNYKGLQTSNYFWMYYKYDELGRVIRQGELDCGATNKTTSVLYDSVRFESSTTQHNNVPFTGNAAQSISTTETEGVVTYSLPSNMVNGTATFTVNIIPGCDQAEYQPVDSTRKHSAGYTDCSAGLNCPCCTVTYLVKYWFEPSGDEYNGTALTGAGPHNITLAPGQTSLKVKVYNITQTPPNDYAKCERASFNLALSVAGNYDQITFIPSSRIYNGAGSYPVAGSLTDLVWNYYDQYVFAGAPANNLTMPGSYSNFPKGRLTKSIIRDPNTNNFTEELFFYDKYGRVVQCFKYIPELAQIKKTDYYYDASGRVLKMAYQDGQSDSFYEWYEYDNLSRVSKVFSSRTNNKASAIKDAEYSYDNTHGGKVLQTKLGPSNQTVDYTYSVRDWLKTINSTQFSETLFYNDASSGARYNGNIAQMSWNTAGNVGAYNFTYDKANRLTDAVSTSGPDFSEKLITYDMNGNIKTLTRSTNSAMNYAYDANIPNRLNSVSGGLAATFGYDVNGNMTSDNTKGTFAYDYRNLPITMTLSNAGGGVVTSIQNQTLSGTYTNTSGDSVSMQGVTINSGSNVTIVSKNGMKVAAGFSSNGATVNLKAGVTSAGSQGSIYTGMIYAAYDAGGQRIKFLKGSASSPQDGSRIYVRGSNGNVIAEYVRSGNNWNPDHCNLYGNGYLGKVDYASSSKFYALQDHLGSNRVILNQSGVVDSWSDYYPFGKESRSSASVNKPREHFTGYQLDAESDLEYAGARYYNATIGKFLSVDPLSDKTPSKSPYNYC